MKSHILKSAATITICGIYIKATCDAVAGTDNRILAFDTSILSKFVWLIEVMMKGGSNA